MLVDEKFPPVPSEKTGWPWVVESIPTSPIFPNNNAWPKVSIVTSSYNQGDYLEKTIRSVLLQGYPNLEYVIIDGGSSDNSVDVIKKYEPWLSYWVSEPDNGIYDAWNKALRVVTGDWIAFIGCGDVFVDKAIGEYVRYIRASDGQLEFVSSQMDIVDSDGQKLRMFGEAWDWCKIRKNMTVAHPGAFHNRRLFEKYGIFNDSYRIAGDYELLLRTKGSLRAGFLAMHTVQMLEGGSSTNLGVFGENYRAKTESGCLNKFVCFFEESDKWWTTFSHYMVRRLRRRFC